MYLLASVASNLLFLAAAAKVKVDAFSAINTCVGHCRAQGPYEFRSPTGALAGGGGVTLTLKLSDNTDYAYEIEPPEVVDAVDVKVQNSELVLTATKYLETVSINVILYMPQSATLAR